MLKEYQKHVFEKEVNRSKISFCGEKITQDWHFQNKDHALKSIENEDRIEPCPICLYAIKMKDILNSKVPLKINIGGENSIIDDFFIVNEEIHLMTKTIEIKSLISSPLVQ